MRDRGCATVVVGQCSPLRDGLVNILRATQSKFRVVAATATIYDPFLEPLERHQLLVLIVNSGSNAHGMATQIQAFRDQQPAGRVAVISDNYDLPLMLSAFRAGANAYFTNIIASDAFIKALELVMLGETIVPSELLSGVPDLAYQIEDPRHVHRAERRPDEALCKLSSREECILRFIAEGDPNKIIARKLDIADATVKVHVKAIFRKIGVQNRTQAAIWWKKSLEGAASTEDKDEMA